MALVMLAVGLASTLSRDARADAGLAGAAAPRPPIIGWLAGGLGWGNVGPQGAAVSRVELAFGRGSRLVSLRYAFWQDTNGTSCDQFICLDGTFDLPRSTSKELALQVGVVKRLYATIATASVGVAGLRTVKRGNHLLSSDSFFGTINYYDSTTRWTGGVAAEAGAYLSSRFVSFGPTLVVDLNPVQPSWGILVDLHLGWMGPGPELQDTPTAGGPAPLLLH
jgi:hypothetical protein